ncbi:anthranilate synthase beta subunit 1, chloroplastic-like isoform X2 [Tripterygium wilfordii]|uniref:anthranilate synthase beta subunit 1, chloroplastic-like isoform X2 n=1 Tax=Tripterygium wilfordii TaxID=458696 RepID=UPI0018F863F4|nr:anthranilate synthase beta subunit 1, chloroplastic-like isoform X2 [Tripterygium wilfordii]
MAAKMLHQASLVQPKASLPRRTLPCPTHLFMRSSTSGLHFGAKKENGFVSGAVVDSNLRFPVESKNNPIIVIDNYDSFTYNLCQYLGELGMYFEVYRNDELTVEELKRKNPRGVLISPGPGKIVRSPFGVMHGKSSKVYYDEKGEDGLLAGLPNPFTAGRYHSLVIEKESFPGEELEITAMTEDGLIMAARHRKYGHLQGVQFHPESIITREGMTIVRNFLKLIERKEAESQN